AGAQLTVCPRAPKWSSPPRKRGSRGSGRDRPLWIPAFAGMTNLDCSDALGNPGAAPPAERPAAVLLWLGHPRLLVLRRLFAAGDGGRDVVDLCRTFDPRIRLVARGLVGGGLIGRGIGGGGLAADRSARRPVRLAGRIVPRGARDRSGDA